MKKSWLIVLLVISCLAVNCASDNPESNDCNQVQKNDPLPEYILAELAQPLIQHGETVEIGFTIFSQEKNLILTEIVYDCNDFHETPMTMYSKRLSNCHLENIDGEWYSWATDSDFDNLIDPHIGPHPPVYPYRGFCLNIDTNLIGCFKCCFRRAP